MSAVHSDSSIPFPLGTFINEAGMHTASTRLNSRRLNSRIAGFVLAIFVLAVGYACSDVVAPRAGPDIFASGTWTSSLWKPEGAGFRHVSSISGWAEVGAKSGKVSVQNSAVREMPLGPVQIESLRSALRSSVVEGGELVTDNKSLKEPAPKGALVRQFKTRSQSLTGPAGENLRLEFVDHPLGSGRPPLAVMIFQDEKPVVFNEFTYERSGTGWRAVRSRSNILDADGKVSLVADQDLSRVGRRGRSVGDAGLTPWLRQGLGSAATQFAKLVQPDALYAGPTASAELDAPCAKEMMNAVVASIAHAAAVLGVATAYASCVELGSACKPLIWGAQALLVAADIALGVAVGELVACEGRAAEPGPVPPPSSGGGGSGGGGGGGTLLCTTTSTYYSWDGGVTWYFMYSTRTCQQVM